MKLIGQKWFRNVSCAVFAGLLALGVYAAEHGVATRHAEHKPGVQLPDDKLEGLVKSALFASIGNEARGVGIEARDGFVMLYGTVRTESTRALAEQAVQRVSGVKSIDNALAIRREG